VNDTLLSAQNNGTVKKNVAVDETTVELVYWEPITPYITKEDFMR